MDDGFKIKKGARNAQGQLFDEKKTSRQIKYYTKVTFQQQIMTQYNIICSKIFVFLTIFFPKSNNDTHEHRLRMKMTRTEQKNCRKTMHIAIKFIKNDIKQRTESLSAYNKIRPYQYIVINAKQLLKKQDLTPPRPPS